MNGTTEAQTVLLVLGIIFVALCVFWPAKNAHATRALLALIGVLFSAADVMVFLATRGGAK